MSSTHFEALTPDEEEALARQQKSRNFWMGIALVVFVFVVIGFTVFMIARTGFVPLDDTDLFRST